MSFALFLIYLAFSYLRPAEMFPELAEFRVMVWASNIALLAALSTLLFGARPGLGKIQTYLVFALAVILAASQALNGWLGGAYSAIVEFATPLTMFLLAILNITSLRRLTITIATLAILMVSLSVESFAAYHFGFMEEQLVLQVNVDDESDVVASDPGKLRRVRSLGFLNDPNDLGQALVTVLPLLWLFWLPERKVRNLFLIGIPTLLILYAIYITHSRGAVLALLVVIFLSARRHFSTWVAVMVVTVGLAALLALNVTGGRSLATKDQSASERIEAWSEGLNMLRSSPLIGIGYNNFTEHNPLTAHNSFVLCFAELGLVGYFIWLSLWMTSYLDLVALRNVEGQGEGEEEQEEEIFTIRKTAQALQYATAGFLVCAWFLSRTYIPSLYLLIGIITAFAYLVKQEGYVPAEISLARWVPRTAVAEVVSIIVVYVIVRLQHA